MMIIKGIIRYLVSFAICFMGMSIADKVLPRGQNWAFGVMFVLGVVASNIDDFITEHME